MRRLYKEFELPIGHHLVSLWVKTFINTTVDKILEGVAADLISEGMENWSSR